MPKLAEGLCQKCGFCCNGVIFADVKLRPAERSAVAKALEPSSSPPVPPDKLKVVSDVSSRLPRSSGPSCKNLPQPCQAFDGRLCRIYADRPQYCREFECALLKRVNSGLLPALTAVSIVRLARKRAGAVRGLLRLMGNSEESSPLAARFRHVLAQAEKNGLEGEAAAVFGKLTTAMQDLNVMLARTFYPGG